jgi:hypothetical protein
MMDSSGFMSNASRVQHPAPVQRPHLGIHYGIPGSYSLAPITTVPGPQSIAGPNYPAHSSYSYGTYQSSPSVPAIASPFKQEYATPRDARMMDDYHARSPSARSPSVTSTVRSTGTVQNSAKRITLNETVNPEDQANFDTGVDILMKAIQSTAGRSDTKEDTPLYAHKMERMDEGQSPASPDSMASYHTDLDVKKKYVCTGPNCNKRFQQKTHLNIHARTHSGEKPFACEFEGCGLTFSQRGNLRTHARRHTGERPFKCHTCDKDFAQKGNYRAHMETHKGLKPYTCKLDNCNKNFTQLGNMKTHQNKYHKSTVAKYTQIFMQYAGSDEMPVEHREMWEYFKEHYKNSNKGIKGRGKHRVVAVKNKGEPKLPRPVSAAPSSQYIRSPSGATSRNLTMPFVSGPPNMLAPIPRSHHQSVPYAMFGSSQEHQGPASSMLYEDANMMSDTSGRDCGAYSH